ncbi:hypothetical protein [Rufibacter ruber]|uniref:hypothetical protein n=1 Tax=Rufibacter ruber TaxID=1783499 RepID=UPI00082C151F|nr:hypothetical protein [Rufibacter ruber]
MKRIALVLGFCGALLLAPGVTVTSSFAQKKGAADKGEPVKTLQVTMGAQSNKSTGGFVEAATGTTYSENEASGNTGKIDFIYLHGKDSGANFVTPASAGLSAFKKLSERVATWEARNEGTLIKLPASEESQQLFESVKTTADLQEAFKKAGKLVTSAAGYKAKDFGPGDRIRFLAAGDVVLFKSKNNVLAVLQVKEVGDTTTGTLTAEVKTSGGKVAGK